MWIKIVLQILSILPQIIEAIRAIESAFTGAPGEAKKAMIVETLTKTVQDVAGSTMKAEDAKILSATIDNAVAVANRFGILKPKAPPVAGPTPR